MPSGRLRLFFASDVHGSDACFRKFLSAADVYRADALILGGDITGKFIVPIFEEGGRYRVSFLGEELQLEGREQLERFMRRASDAGCYPYVTKKEPWQELLLDRTKFQGLFVSLMRKRLEQWLAYAEERLKGRHVGCYIIPGNDDETAIDDLLGSSRTIVNANEKVLELAPWLQMVSLGYANLTPWRCPRDISEEELWAKLEKLLEPLSSPAILNVHVPPYDSGIDMAPELDQEMRPKLGPGGQVLMAPVGSKAVRRAIEAYQPLLGLHGHVHEGRGFARIGRTLCLNPGSEYQEAVLRGVLVELEGAKVKDFIFTSG